MGTLKSDFLNTVKERGFLHQCTDLDGLDNLLAEKKPVTAYIGFDCTAPSLHVGSLMQIMILRWWQNSGHRPIVLMGGGTTKIGDPSGKDEARKLLTNEQIAINMEGIKNNFERFIQFGDTGNSALMLNNDDWLKDLNYLAFLRDYGRHFSVNRMLNMDSVRLRLEREQNLSFLEFNYMILQAYDFAKLSTSPTLGGGGYDCRLQVGGADQWSNIIAGIDVCRAMLLDYITKALEAKNDKDLEFNVIDEFIRIKRKEIASSEGEKRKRLYESAPNEIIKKVRDRYSDFIFGLTTPLITTSSGAKMGKTESGAVWLNAEMCSPFDYWQFWRNTEDGDVGRFLRFFTELPIAEIEKLEKLQGAEINEAKKTLATEATRLCHGEEAAHLAADTARKTFEEGGAGENLKTIAHAEGDTVRDLLVRAGLAESGGDAKKLIAGGGVRINDEPVSDPNLKLTASQFSDQGTVKLSKGRKHHVLVKLKN